MSIKNEEDKKYAQRLIEQFRKEIDALLKGVEERLKFIVKYESDIHDYDQFK